MTKFIITNNIKTIKKYLSKQTVLFFDIDNTIIQPIQMFGYRKWALYFVDELKKKGVENKEAIRQFFKIYKNIEQYIDFTPTEKNTVPILEHLQEESLKFYFLTMRTFDMQQITEKHMNAIKIPRDKDCSQKIIFKNKNAGYEKGIIYSGINMKKGDFLYYFLKKNNLKDQHVIFVDDSINHIKNVAKTLSLNNISHTCIHYTASNTKEKKFNIESANLLLEKTIGKKHYLKILKCYL